ncbi:low-density lipoprotein receptor-related protein 2-like isoform X2 [Planococcus citri]|uniref:low-density lipoprotein receptor-related protein 2-like isoform X2 n=1 Tax=Planococcus citri TaxID=170843 RepID=UPI0031F9B816
MNFNIEMFKWFHFQYLVILLLVCDNTILNHQINGKEITEIYDKPCITPDNQPGYCISLTNCSHLQSKLGKFPVLPELVTFLRKSRCDQESVEKTHKVCCSVLNSADTSSFLTSESLLSQHENGKNTTGCGKTNRAVWKLAGGWNSTLDENQQTDSGPKIQATECKSWEFKCDNGQCISKWDACNGTSECEDKSDETCHRCLNTTCGHSRFRCDYGACIYENQQCDGSVDCRDGSDESLRACNITIDETEKEQLIGFEGNFCTVLIPTPDKTITYQCNEKDSQTCGKSGIVHENTVALIKCNTGYYTIYNKTGSSSVCKNTKWVPSIADCFTPADVKAKIRKIQMEPCSEFEFRCSNGQCIYEWFLCDGISDCVDNSDETLRQCSATRCGKEQFRCNYGGCIDAQYRCDGLKQCNDGSDEAPSTCATKQGSNTNSCAVPQPSQGETITYTCNNNTSNPCQVNGYIPEHSFAVIQCNPGYFLSNNVLSYQSRCINSKWVPQIYQCLKQCGEFTSTNMGGRCYYKGIQISCNSKSFLAGTLIRPKCKVFYTEADTDNTGIGPDYTQFTCDQQGQWNPEITSEYGNRAISCVHECDQNFVQRQFIRTAVVEPEGKSPWQVAIYNVDKILICGGTIIRPKIVLSAAHCFHTDANKGEVNIADYEVVVGKITRDYSLIDNEEQKSFKIRELRFSKKGYFGLSNNFAADIVIIILEQSITYGNLVKPAEYKPDSLYSANPPAEGNPGKLG